MGAGASVSIADIAGATDEQIMNTLKAATSDQRRQALADAPAETRDRLAAMIGKIDAVEFQQGLLSVTILGATGDLAKKETYPGLLDLWGHGFLPAHCAIVGFGRSAFTDENFRSNLRPWLEKAEKDLGDQKEEHINAFLTRCFYFQGAYDSAEDFARLATTLKEREADLSPSAPQPGMTNRLFYFAIPPFVFLAAAQSIKASAQSTTGFNRLIIEKPFGDDLKSAQKLAGDLAAIFPEEQLFRMDHFLGKEVLQNLLLFRASNQFLEPLLNAEFVACVVVTLKEDFGTEGRGGYFTHYGIIRDVMQNHLLQMLVLLAMDLPEEIIGPNAGNCIRDGKVKALQEMLPLDPNETVIGQYVAAGTKPGYMDDDSIKDVEKAKICPTYAQIIMRFKSKRWQGVPFIMRAGKAMNEHKCEIRVQFKKSRFAEKAHLQTVGNELVMRVYPDEAIWLKVNMKTPGLDMVQSQSELDLSYGTRFKGIYCPEAYTRLLLAGLQGNPENFVRGDELLESWKLFTPLLEHLEGNRVEPLAYAYGAKGIPEAYAQAKENGFVQDPNYHWMPPPGNDNLQRTGSRCSVVH